MIIQVEVPRPPELKREDVAQSGEPNLKRTYPSSHFAEPDNCSPLISAGYYPSHIQVSQAAVFHHHTRIAHRLYILHQEPNRRAASSTPRRRPETPLEGQSAGRRQAAEGVQRPRRRHHQPDGQARRRLGSHQGPGTTCTTHARGDSVVGPHPTDEATRPWPHPLGRPLPHAVLAARKTPRHPARRRGRVHALRGGDAANRTLHSAVHVPNHRVSAGVLGEAACVPQVR